MCCVSGLYPSRVPRGLGKQEMRATGLSESPLGRNTLTWGGDLYTFEQHKRMQFANVTDHLSTCQRHAKLATPFTEPIRSNHSHHDGFPPFSTFPNALHLSRGSLISSVGGVVAKAGAWWNGLHPEKRCENSLRLVDHVDVGSPGGQRGGKLLTGPLHAWAITLRGTQGSRERTRHAQAVLLLDPSGRGRRQMDVAPRVRAHTMALRELGRAQKVFDGRHRSKESMGRSMQTGDAVSVPTPR